MVVDFPAPFGPMNAMTRPGRTTKLRILDRDLVPIAFVQP
jgi:hypothetical protein